MENTGTCTSCGSSSFEEIDGLYYCSICSTQRTGFTVEVRQYEDGMVNILGQSISERKKKKKKKKDFGVPWTNIEAYNHILNHQCRQLEKKLNLGPKFRAILFGLWSSYLEKCEIAFTGDKNAKPKINLTSRYRDTQLLAQGKDQITVPLRPTNNRLIRRKIGNTILKRICNTKYGDDAKSVRSEREVSLPSENEDTSDSDSEEDEDEFERNERLRLARESQKNRYADDYGEVDEDDTHRLDLSFNKDENLDLDDIPMIEWTEEQLQENFLYNYNYNTLAIENFKKIFDHTSDRDAVTSSRPSKPFSANATKAITLTEIESTRVDVDGLKPFSFPGRILDENEVRPLARKYVKRFDDGEDFNLLMKELDQLFKKKKSKQSDGRKKRKTSLSKEADIDADADGNSNSNGQNNEMDDPNDVQEEPLELSKRSQLLKRIAEGFGVDPKSPKPISIHHAYFLTMEKMSMTRTVQFLYLALKIGGYNVHCGDLIHWILRGHLTFFGSQTVLPENWYFLSVADISMLRRIVLVQPSQLDVGAADLRRFLRIPTLPLPDFTEIVMRHVYDFNLPLRLVDLIIQKVNYPLINKISKSRFRIDPEATYLPDFSVALICSLIVIIRKLFNIDGSTEKLISNHVRQNWPDSFIFEDWFKDNQILWKLMTNHFFPGLPELYKDIPDVDVIRYHREQFTNHWFGGSETKYTANVPYATQEWRTNYAKSIEDTFEVEPCTVEPPPFTVYHYYEAKKFVANRIIQLGGSSFPPSSLSTSSQSINIFDANYKTKSIDYLFDQSYTKFYNCNPSKLTYSPQKEQFNHWPETLRLMVKIASFITHRSTTTICQSITALDKLIKL